MTTPSGLRPAWESLETKPSRERPLFLFFHCEQPLVDCREEEIPGMRGCVDGWLYDWQCTLYLEVSDTT